MTRDTPAPLPPIVSGELYMKLGDRQLAGLDDNGRFIVRQLVADAYASGFQDGRQDEMRASQVNRQAEHDALGERGEVKS